MWVKILIGLAAVIAVFLIVVAFQPSHFRITRSITVAAPPAAIHPLVNDFHKWDAWSPWEKMDPDLQRTYEGPAAGKGATYRWTSAKNEVGVGSMVITESQPQSINLDLNFVKPMEGSNKVEFTFTPQGDQTLVTWTMNGQNNFICKAFCMFMNMDKMVGTQFESGLAQIKATAEAASKL